MPEYVGIDCETLPIDVGMAAPPIVCVQIVRAGSPPSLTTRARGALQLIRELLEGPAVLVGHNVAYDAACWANEPDIGPALVYAKYSRGQILCTYVFERLGEIAGYSTRKALNLATCMQAHGLAAPSLKDAGLATGFGQFIDAAEIPEPYRTYALEDTQVIKLFERQLRRFRGVPLAALERLSQRAYALQRMSVRGVYAAPEAVEALERAATEELDRLRPLAREWGFVRDDDTTDTMRLMVAARLAYGKACPVTPGGKPQTSEQILDQADDPRLKAFARYRTLRKTVDNDVVMLKQGTLHTKYGIADTLRTTSSKPALQNIRQFGGVRECIQPRPGYAFYIADASAIEVCTLAQLCGTRLDRWGMVERLREIGNPGLLHTQLGATLARQDYETFAARVRAKEPDATMIRTRAKNTRFGAMGGMGAQALSDYMRMNTRGQIVLSLEEARLLIKAWKRDDPDAAAWLRVVGEGEKPNGTHDAELAYGLVRRGVWYSAAANNPFQSLAAEIFGDVLWMLERECTSGRLSPCRPVLFVHDEVVLECPLDDVDELDRLFIPMVQETARRAMPDVATVWEAEASTCYSKAAKRVTDTKGRLIPWAPPTR